MNEPYSYKEEVPSVQSLIQIETDWLRELAGVARAAGAVRPIGFSLPGDSEKLMERVRPFSDIFLVHPYFRPGDTGLSDEKLRREFSEEVKACKAYADSQSLPVIATETCWGALSDKERAEIVRFTLENLQEAGIGFTVHALYYSRVADLHYEADGFVGGAGNLAFTNKDGSLREGHEVFNEFCR